MAETGVLQTPQSIPDAAQPVQGIPGSRATFYLRSTPRVFTLLAAGQSNQDFQIAAVQPVDVPQVLRDSRLPFYNPPRVDNPTYKTGGASSSLSASGADASLATRAGGARTVAYANGYRGTGVESYTPEGLYASLLEADRPLGWWSFDADRELLDESGRGFDLTSVGSWTIGDPLLVHGQKLQDRSRDFDGGSDAAYTLGTLYSPPTTPPPYHSATYAGGSSASLELVTPADVRQGDLVLFFLAHSSQTATISTAPSDVTQVGTTLNAGTCAAALYKYVPGADEPPTGRTWTWSSSGTVLGVCLVYRGCDPDVSGLVYDSGQQATASGSFHSTTSETFPLQARTLALWAGEFAGTLAPDPTNLRLRADVSAGNLKIVAADYEHEEAGSAACTATTSAATTLGAFLVTFGSDETVLENALDALDANASIHALIHPDTVAAGTRTVVRKDGSWGLQVNGSTVEFVYTDGGGTDRTVTGPTVSASATTHLVVADDGTDIHFFKNGAETTSSRLGAAGYTTNANQVTVGAYYDGSYSNYFDGRIDEVAVWNAALSSQMVATYYEAHSAGTFGVPLTAGLPSVKLEIAWTSNPTDDCFVWEDVTADLRADQGASVTRGRNLELDRVEAGRMDFTLDNRSRQYDSATNSYVVPTRPVRLRAQPATDGQAYPIFFGYTEGHPLTRENYGRDSVATFTAIDTFKMLSLDKVLGTFVRPEELSGERIRWLLDGLPGAAFEGDDGISLVVGDDLSNTNTLDHCQGVTETEGGQFFSDRSGVLVFQDRQYRIKNERTVRATYGDGGGSELPLKGIEPTYDEANLYTAAAVTNATGTVQRAIDVGQAIAHFVRTKEVTTVGSDDNQAQGQAEAYAHRYATPRIRVPELKLQPAGSDDPAKMWASVLSHEISHRIKSVERPIGDTSAISREHFVEGIRHDIRGSDWTVTLSVSPAELEGEYLQLDTGQLDQDGGLATARVGW